MRGPDIELEAHLEYKATSPGASEFTSTDGKCKGERGSEWRELDTHPDLICSRLRRQFKHCMLLLCLTCVVVRVRNKSINQKIPDVSTVLIVTVRGITHTIFLHMSLKPGYEMMLDRHNHE